jgi:hypothetical protein
VTCCPLAVLATTPVTHDVFGQPFRRHRRLPRTAAGTDPAAVRGPSGPDQSGPRGGPRHPPQRQRNVYPVRRDRDHPGYRPVAQPHGSDGWDLDAAIRAPVAQLANRLPPDLLEHARRRHPRGKARRQIPGMVNVAAPILGGSTLRTTVVVGRAQQRCPGFRSVEVAAARCWLRCEPRAPSGPTAGSSSDARTHRCPVRAGQLTTFGSPLPMPSALPTHASLRTPSQRAVSQQHGRGCPKAVGCCWRAPRALPAEAIARDAVGDAGARRSLARPLDSATRQDSARRLVKAAAVGAGGVEPPSSSVSDPTSLCQPVHQTVKRPGRIIRKPQVDEGVSARALRRPATVLQGACWSLRRSVAARLLPDAPNPTLEPQSEPPVCVNPAA